MIQHRNQSILVILFTLLAIRLEVNYNTSMTIGNQSSEVKREEAMVQWCNSAISFF